MRGRLALAVAAVGAGAVLVPVAASGQYGYTQPGSPQPGQQAGATQPGATQVYAEGNFANPSALKFDPPEVTVTVGSTVRWTNTDNAVPHTATEDHGLWDLGGDYGGTPANPSGFGPGASVQRVFEAGTQHYYCRVHPTQMHGVVAVPVSLALVHRRVVRRVRVRRRVRRHGRLRTLVHVRRQVVRAPYVRAIWAVVAPPANEVFDVQVRRGGGGFSSLRNGTHALQALLAAGPRGTVVTVRARLRHVDQASQATDWSPLASVTSA